MKHDCIAASSHGMRARIMHRCIFLQLFLSQSHAKHEEHKRTTNWYLQFKYMMSVRRFLVHNACVLRMLTYTSDTNAYTSLNFHQ